MRLVMESLDSPGPVVTHESKPFLVGDSCRFLFDDASIDLIVFSLTGSLPVSAGRLHGLFSEIRRVLAPEGELLILAQNRYGYRRITETLRRSTREGGMYTRFRALGAGGIQLYTDGKSLPSRRGLQALLTRAGLRSSQWFRPLRDRTGHLREIRPLVPRDGEWAAYQPMRQGGRIRKMPRFADEFVVRASAGALAPSALQCCLKAIAREIGSGMSSEQLPRIERCLVTPKEKMVVIARLADAPVVIRIPLSEAAHEGCLRNLRALRVIDAEPVCRGLAPIPLAEGETAGYYYTVESRLNGDPLGRSALGQNGLAQVEFLIQKLNPRSLTRQTILDGALYDELVTTPLNKVLALIPEAYKQNRLERFFKDRLLGKQVSVGISHGDFSLSNIFVQDNKITGVIDWDDSCLSGLPVTDAISHLCSRQIRRGNGFADTFLGLASRQWPDTDELDFLNRCYVRFQTDLGIHAGLVLLFWMHVVISQLGFGFAYKSSFLRTRIDEIINAVSCETSL